MLCDVFTNMTDTLQTITTLQANKHKITEELLEYHRENTTENREDV